MKHWICEQSLYECSFVQALSTSRNDDNSVETKGTNTRQMPVFQRLSCMISVFKVSSDPKSSFSYHGIVCQYQRCDSVLTSHSKPEVQRHALGSDSSVFWQNPYFDPNSWKPLPCNFVSMCTIWFSWFSSHFTLSLTLSFWNYKGNSLFTNDIKAL